MSVSLKSGNKLRVPCIVCIILSMGRGCNDEWQKMVPVLLPCIYNGSESSSGQYSAFQQVPQSKRHLLLLLSPLISAGRQRYTGDHHVHVTLRGSGNLWPQHLYLALVQVYTVIIHGAPVVY